MEAATAGINTPKPTKRHYKTFIINIDDGSVKKMKVWDGYNE
jgi:hypothetical protein